MIQNCVWSAIVAASFLWVLSPSALAYPTRYGPFEAGQSPQMMPWINCVLEKQYDANDKSIGENRIYRPNNSNKSESEPTLTVHGSDNGWIINVRDANGKLLMPSPATNNMASSQMEVFSCDLNHDRKPDFIVNIWSGGCGLAAEGSEVTFLLSSKDGYRATSFYLFGFGPEDLIRFKIDGPVYLILNDIVNNDGEKTSDGRNHNFWVYTLRRIDGTEFIDADSDRSGFPKWVWYSYRENHEETTLLTSEQKAILMKKRHEGS